MCSGWRGLYTTSPVEDTPHAWRIAMLLNGHRLANTSPPLWHHLMLRGGTPYRLIPEAQRMVVPLFLLATNHYPLSTSLPRWPGHVAPAEQVQVQVEHRLS